MEPPDHASQYTPAEPITDWSSEVVGALVGNGFGLGGSQPIVLLISFQTTEMSIKNKGAQNAVIPPPANDCVSRVI